MPQHLTVDLLGSKNPFTNDNKHNQLRGQYVNLFLSVSVTLGRPPDSILIYIVATLSSMSLGFIVSIVMNGSGKTFGTLAHPKSTIKHKRLRLRSERNL